MIMTSKKGPLKPRASRGVLKPQWRKPHQTIGLGSVIASGHFIALILMVFTASVLEINTNAAIFSVPLIYSIHFSILKVLFVGTCAGLLLIFLGAVFYFASKLSRTRPLTP